MTPDIAESLIRPALRAERNFRHSDTGPICRRELRRGEDGCWRGYLLFHDNGWLPDRCFSNADGLRLRLLPTEPNKAGGLVYDAMPEENGWRVQRLGRVKRSALPLKPDFPFALAAFSDGREKGEAIIEPAISDPAEFPSFWRADRVNEGEDADRLVPLAGTARTRGCFLWILTSENTSPQPDDGLIVDKIEPAPGGHLCRISGKGIIQINELQFRVETGAKANSPDSRLLAFGNTLRRWRLPIGNTPIYRGNVEFRGQVGANRLVPVRKTNIHQVQGRELCSEVAEWTQGKEAMAHLRLVRMPDSISLKLKEISAGKIRLSARGLEIGWRIQLRAGEHSATGDSTDGTVELTLVTPGKVPGRVLLRLSEPKTGRVLILKAAWPAQDGMIVDPCGVRLERNQKISVDSLQGWCACAPEGIPGELQLQLTGSRAVSLRIAGEVPLSSYITLVKSMLAQGGPDSQVNLIISTSGREGARLEIRRYHEFAVVKNGTMWTGLDRDSPETIDSTLKMRPTEVKDGYFHAVNLKDTARFGPFKISAPVKLDSFLDRSQGPWLIQSQLEDRIQRAAVWNPDCDGMGSRGERVTAFAEKWQKLLNFPHDPDWKHLWNLMSVVEESGDLAALDEVQALALVPTAAIVYAFRVPAKEITEVFALEAAAPIFWPVLPTSDYEQAVQVAHNYFRQTFSRHFADHDAQKWAIGALAHRIGEILLLRPELAGHLCIALHSSGLLSEFFNMPETLSHLDGLFTPEPKQQLINAAQAAAKRFDRLPQGLGSLKPVKRPDWFPVFNPHAQIMIDSPLRVAELATQCRSVPSVNEKLILVILRYVDQLYFDAALPAAVTLFQSGEIE